MLTIKKDTIKLAEKAEKLMKATKKLMGKCLGMSYIDMDDLDDDQALLIKDSLNLMDQAYEYAELQAKQFDQINERLADLEELIKNLKKQQG